MRLTSGDITQETLAKMTLMFLRGDEQDRGDNGQRVPWNTRPVNSLQASLPPTQLSLSSGDRASYPSREWCEPLE